MSSVNNSMVLSELMCGLPNGEVLYSACFTPDTNHAWVCTLVKLLSSTQVFLGAVGGHVPQVFGSVPGQVCAKFQGLGLLDGTYYIELQFSHGSSVQTQLQFSSALKSSSPKALKHFALVGQAVDALMNGTSHPASKAMQAPFTAAVPVLQLPQAGNTTAATSPPKAPKPAKPKPAAPAYNFHVDGIIGGVVEGWVWCPHKPENRYEVQAWCGERLAAYGIANIFREDLANAGKADGKIKFELPLARYLLDGKTHTLQIRVVGQGEIDTDKVIKESLMFDAPNRPWRDELIRITLNYEESLMLIHRYLKSKGANFIENNLLIHKIEFYLKNNNSKAARKIINEAKFSIDEHFYYNLKLAESYFIEKNFEEAVRIYYDALNCFGKNQYLFFGIAICFKLMKKDSDAKYFFERYIEIGSDLERINFAKSFIFELTEKLEKENKKLKAAKDLDGTADANHFKSDLVEDETMAQEFFNLREKYDALMAEKKSLESGFLICLKRLKKFS